METRTEARYTEGPPRQVGKVSAQVVVTNRIDQARAAAGEIGWEEVRSATLDEVVVDTGGTLLCLPADVIASLGLGLLREVEVETATGKAPARLFRDLTVVVEGREGTFDCLEPPGGSTALLGVVPLEVLGLEPDLRNQRLKQLPMNERETYLTIL